MPSGTGKWAEHGVPHKGWTCVDMEDLLEPIEICEMCEAQEIRYVHTMAHPDYPEELRCGCICAGHMEESIANSERREATLKNAARRRAAWPRRKAWRISQKGNLVIRTDGYRITVFKKEAGWSAVISNSLTGLERFARRSYASPMAAQLLVHHAFCKFPSCRLVAGGPSGAMKARSA